MKEDAIYIHRPSGIPDALFEAVTDQLLSYSAKSLPLTEKYGEIPWVLSSSAGLHEDTEKAVEMFHDLAKSWKVKWSPKLIAQYLLDADSFYASSMEHWGLPRPTKRIWEMTREEYEHPVDKKQRIIHLSELGVHNLPTGADILEVLKRWSGSVIEKVRSIPNVGTFYDPMREVIYCTPSGERRWAYVVLFSGVDSFEEEYVVSDRPVDPHGIANLIQEWNATMSDAYPARGLPIHHDAVLLARRLAGGDFWPHLSQNPPVRDVLKDTPLYHAISDEQCAKETIEVGLILPRAVQGRACQSPRKGFVHMNPSLKMAAIYALGGFFMGREYTPDMWRRSGRYGYVFLADPASLGFVALDEGDVGEMATNDLYHRGPPWLKAMAEEYGRESFARQKKLQYAKQQSMIGKRLLRRMSDQQKGRLLALLETNVAHDGPVRFSAAWILDKLDAPKIRRDGANLLEVARRLSRREDISWPSGRNGRGT